MREAQKVSNEFIVIAQRAPSREAGERGQTHLGEVERSRLGAVVVVAVRPTISSVPLVAARLSSPLLKGRASSSTTFALGGLRVDVRGSTVRERRIEAYRSMCKTFFPSTDSNPERTHSVKPVPRMICALVKGCVG
jgi:hypothetical protein